MAKLEAYSTGQPCRGHRNCLCSGRRTEPDCKQYLHRILVSGILLKKARLTTIVRDDKVVISHNGVIVGKGYLNGSLFVLNLASKTLNRNASTSAYIAESVDLWHGRLGHVNFASIKWLKHMQSIPDVNIDNFSKCVMCVEAKYAEKPFKSVTSKQIELLKLVHSDLVDFKNIASKGEKNDCITFADDCSRYTKVYLLRSKKEVEEMFLKYKVEVKNQSD